MKKRILFLINIFVLSLVYITSAQDISDGNITSGPVNGALVVVGGGPLDEVILQRFIDLAGGPEAIIVVVPTAGGRESYNEDSGGAGQLRKYGATNVTVLHTNDRKIADTDAFVQPLLAAKAVWFGGGRQWRLVDA